MSADSMQQPSSSVYPGTPPQQQTTLFTPSGLPSQSPARQFSQHQQYPNVHPTTPRSNASTANVSSPKVKISPETLASLTGVASPFSQQNSVDSPISSTFSEHNMGMGDGGNSNGGYARTASLALANVVGQGGKQSQQNQNGGGNGMNGSMDLDMNNYANYLQSAPPNAFPNQVNPAHPSYYYPPASNSAPPTATSTPNISHNSTPSLATHPPPSHPTIHRHHPYAHASRPSLTSNHSSQNSVPALPLYISTTPASASGTPPPNSAGPVDHPSASIGLGVPPQASQVPQRVHSAPAHILSLATSGLDGYAGSAMQSGESESQGARDQRMMLGGESQQQQDQEAALKMLMDAHAAATNGSMQQTNPSSLGPPFLSIEIPSPNPNSIHAPPPSAPPVLTTADESFEEYNDAVSSAILLLHKRLPIMEAALTTSAAEPGQDEEEIWKGIEAAFGDLKRIMGDRKERRRQSVALNGGKGSPTKARGRQFSRMDIESPTTAHPSTSSFHSNPQPPPLVHSHSTPNIPITAHANAARQAAIAQVQRQQQAQFEAQFQAQAQAHAQIQIQAETDRARADEEVRVKQEAEAEAEAIARAGAEQEAANQVMREQQQQQQAAADHYQQLLHEESLRLARERLHQQMQEGAAGSNPNLPNPPPTAQLQPLPPPQQTQFVPQTQQASQSQSQAQQSAMYGNATNFPSNPLPPPPSVASSSHPSQNLPPPATASSAFAQPVYNPNPPPNPAQLPPSQQPTQPQPQSLPPTFHNAFDPSSTDLAMLQQMHLPDLTFTPNANSLSLPPESIDPSALNGQQHSSSTHSNTPQTSTTSASPVTSNTPGSLSGSTGPIRPSRSRAASQSGSRSRAASGSGYQSLLENRSRAASSASSIFQSFERDEEDEMDDFEGGDIEIDPEVTGSGAATSTSMKGVSSQLGAASAGVDAETKAKMDPVFLEFLADICSNLDATDLKGEPIHQTLMAKKMEKLDQSHDFRPFKFRIQAFTTAFSERLTASGIFGPDVPIKKIRQYLWAQPFISRFNDDGKKAKSKGNHIWTVEAKKMPDKRWMFREFVRCIKGAAPAVGFIGLTWSWAPRVWDPQCSSSAIDASFMSPTLPPWLSWEDNVLSGEVPEAAHGQSFDIEAVATFQMGSKVHQLRAMTSFVVASANETEDPAALSHAVSLHAAMIRAQNSRGGGGGGAGDDDHRASTNDGSQDVSPAGSSLPLYRSPSMGSSAVFEQQQQQQTQSLMLPNPIPSGGSFPGSELGTPAPLDNNVFAQHLQQQQQQYQSELPQMDMQVDESMNSFQAQAALHQHYANITMQNPSFHAVSPTSLSYPPPPELVSNALQDASAGGVNPAYTMNGAMLSHPSTHGTGTPNTVFHLHDMGQQPPFTTLDPSHL